MWAMWGHRRRPRDFRPWEDSWHQLGQHSFYWWGNQGLGRYNDPLQTPQQTRGCVWTRRHLLSACVMFYLLYLYPFLKKMRGNWQAIHMSPLIGKIWLYSLQSLSRSGAHGTGEQGGGASPLPLQHLPSAAWNTFDVCTGRPPPRYLKDKSSLFGFPLNFIFSFSLFLLFKLHGHLQKRILYFTWSIYCCTS